MMNDIFLIEFSFVPYGTLLLIHLIPNNKLLGY